MVISAWIAVGMFVMATGQSITDTAGPFQTKAECEATNVENAPVFKASDRIVAFGLTCAEVQVSDDGKLAPKAEPKAKPAPSRAPIEQRETGIGLDGRTYL